MSMLKRFIISLLVAFLFQVPGASDGTDEVSVMEGDSVTLNTNIKINQGVRIRWYYDGFLIARISGDRSETCTDVQCNEDTGRFRDRLKLDHQTGSLTIMNIRTEHAGDYHLKFSSSSSGKRFIVSVHGVPAEQDEVKRKTAKEGEAFTLESPEGKKYIYSLTWYFNDTLIMSGDHSQICTDDQCEERFRDRLKLDHQTGSLTITNTTTEDSGEYKLQINISTSSFSIRRNTSFSVTVTGQPDRFTRTNDPGSGLSPGAIVGICVGVLLVSGAFAVAVGIYYYHMNSRSVVDKKKILQNGHNRVKKKEKSQEIPQDQCDEECPFVTAMINHENDRLT